MGTGASSALARATRPRVSTLARALARLDEGATRRVNVRVTATARPRPRERRARACADEGEDTMVSRWSRALFAEENARDDEPGTTTRDGETLKAREGENTRRARRYIISNRRNS